MKKQVVFKKSDFLWSISELVGFNPQDRLDWVQKTNFNSLVKFHIMVTTFSMAEGDGVLAPVYAVVNTLRKSKAGFPIINKGYFYDIISVEFAANINEATALINREASSPFLPFLYMWDWNCQAFKKVEYNLGCFRLYEDEDYVAQEMRVKDFEFEFDMGIEKEYFESADDFDLYNEYEDCFIEIPNIYEFTYFNESGSTVSADSEVMRFKNINNAIDEAVYTMYELGYEETLIENSWVRISIYADYNQFEMRKEPVDENGRDCNDWHFRKSCYAHILFKFTSEYRANHPLEDYLAEVPTLGEFKFECEDCEKDYICTQNCDWDGDCIECQANGGCKYCDKKDRRNSEKFSWDLD